MHTRLVWTAPLVLAAALLAACGNNGGSGGLSTPGLGERTAPASGQATAPSSMAPGNTQNGEAISTFCEQWKTQVAAAWPPDAATAATLAPMFTEWAKAPEFATVGADLTTVGTWLAQQGGSTSATAPDAATTEAYNRIVTFATANCPGA